jgi:hypothetical protein
VPSGVGAGNKSHRQNEDRQTDKVDMHYIYIYIQLDVTYCNYFI